MDVLQVEPVGLAVDLEEGARGGGAGDDLLDVDRSGRPLVDQPCRQVADAVHVRAGHRREHALSGAPGEGGVQRGDDPVEAAELLVGEVERAVGADVDLDAAQHAEGGEPLVERGDLGGLLLEAAVTQALRVIADRHVLVAARDRRGRHLLEARAAVRPGGVAVQLAAQRAGGDEVGQAAAPARVEPGGAELAGALAQLRWDPVVAEERVDAALILVGRDLAGRLGRDAVLRDREAAALRLFPQLHVVLLGAGEVLEQVAEALRLDDAQVELEAFARDDGGLRLALCYHVEHPGERGEVCYQSGGVARGRDQVDVLEGLAAAAQRPGLRDAHRAREREQLVHRSERGWQAVAKQRARLLAGPLVARGVECLDDRLLELRANAAQRAQLLALGGGAQALDGRDAELLPELARRLRPESR